MDILQICPGAYQSGRGGISEHVRNISEHLAEKHSVTVYATNPGGSLPWWEIVNKVKVRRFKRIAPSGSYFFSPSMIANLLKARFDVVHGHGYNSLPMHSSSLTTRKKLVLSTHFHGVGHSVFRNFLFRLFKPIGRRTLLTADRVIAVSAYERNLLCKYFGFDPSRVIVIPNGLNLNEFAGLERRKTDSRSILYVGRLESYKGVQYLVEIMPEFEDDVVLEIVGKGPLRRILENQARKLGVHDRVLFSQDLSRRSLLQKYADADVFVLLSRHEAYSLVVAEALAAGTPCVVADTSALSEWIDDRSCFGVGVPLKLGKLAKLIEEVLNSRIKDAGIEKWIGTKILSWDGVVRRLEEIYTQDS